MRVMIEAGDDEGFGTQYRLRILDGYRAGAHVREPVLDRPLSDVDRSRLSVWAQNTGYEVVS